MFVPFGELASIGAAAPHARPLIDRLKLAPSGAWSLSRRLAASQQPPYYSAPSTDILTVYGQAQGRDLTGAGVKPTEGMAGPYARACARYAAGGGQLLHSGALNLSDFLGDAAGYAIFSLLVDAVTLNSADSYSGDIVFTDAANQNTGLYLHANGGAPRVRAYGWDGGDKFAAAPIGLGVPMTIEYRVAAGKIGVRVNGASWVETAIGTIMTLANQMRVGALDNTGTQHMTARLFEALMFSTPPASAKQDAIAADLVRWAGAQCRVVVFDGDSYAHGQTGNTGWPGGAIPLLSGVWQSTNLGVNGQTMEQQAANYATNVAPLLGTAAFNPTTVYCTVPSSNDVAPRTAAQMKSDLQTVCSAAKTAGAKVVVGTLPVWNYGSPFTLVDAAARDDFNDFIRHTLTGVEGVFDVAGTPLDDVANLTNPLYFRQPPDLVPHPTTYSYQTIWGPLVAAAIDSVS